MIGYPSGALGGLRPELRTPCSVRNFFPIVEMGPELVLRGLEKTKKNTIDFHARTWYFPGGKKCRVGAQTNAVTIIAKGHGN